MIKTSVALLTIPDVMLSTLSGLYDTLNAFELVSEIDNSVPAQVPFEVQLVAGDARPQTTASGIAVRPHQTLREAATPDVVIVPSLLLEHGTWRQGRYPEVVEWLKTAHEQGAILASACSGVLLVAETGLLAGLDATVHWAYADAFRKNFPEVNLRVEEGLVASGPRGEFIMSGASASWSDLVLYLVARIVGPTSAQALARYLLLQWHTEGQAPYMTFTPRMDHGDAAVLSVQRWLATNVAIASPVDAMTRYSGLSERTFKRRFVNATGLSPISYVQHLRVESAKRLLEQTDAAADEVSFQVGYLDPAAFRRVFRRITRLTPSEYRRRFRTPFVAHLADRPSRS